MEVATSAVDVVNTLLGCMGKDNRAYRRTLCVPDVARLIDEAVAPLVKEATAMTLSKRVPNRQPTTSN